MKLTKYSHACFTVEKDASALVVDPGVWSPDLAIPPTVAGVIVTHEHPDHCDAGVIRDIMATNPEAKLIAASAVTSQFPDLPTQRVGAGETVTIGGFRLSFYGGEHALIDYSLPRVANIGVMIDDQLYYPGDSFVIPDAPVTTLLLPVSAPWLKVSEVFDFVSAVRPEHIIPTHDAILSEVGKTLLDRLVATHAATVDSDYQRLDGQSIVL